MDPLCHRPIGFGHDCASFHIQFYISSLNSGSIDIMDHSFRIEFQAARASVERHGPQPVFQLPWEKGIWRRIFNPSPTPLAVISHSLPLPSSFPSSPNFQFNNMFNSDSNVNSNPNSSFFSSLSSSVPHIHPSHAVISSNLPPTEPPAEFWSKFFGYSDVQEGRSDGLRHLAISRFISMLASSAGSSMFLSSSDPWDLHASFSAAMSMKATSTIIKRSLDLLRYKNWCDTHQKQFIPFSECILWQFLRELQQVARPSGPQSILQAVNFAIHVLGCQVQGPSLASVRIKGLCAGHKALAFQIKHAPPLSVAQIILLENLCCATTDIYSKLLYGSILVALYARSRWKDLQGAHSIDFDPDDFSPQFVELPSQHFKTSAMLAKKLHFLPITAIVFSLSGQPWIHHFIQARRHLQLENSGKLSSPFLPRRIDAALSQQPVTSSQITKLLREVLRSDTVRSHSLKHTCLSFAAKRGLDPHVRKLLGYHLDHHEVTLATYSRDLLAEPLRQLKTLLTEIQSGIFVPDSTRSGYLPEQPSLPIPVDDNAETDESLTSSWQAVDHFHDAIEQHDTVEPLDTTDLFDRDSSSSSSSGSSSSSIEDNDQVDSVPNFPSHMGDNCYPQAAKFLPVKHRQTHRLHLLVDAEHTRLICGRALSQTYERLDHFPTHPLPTCVQCFASKLVGSFDEC